mgnify:CR=1 FL=1
MSGLLCDGAYEKDSRVFVYSPLVKESDYIDQKSKSFLERYFHGDITAMLSTYIENDHLSETELEDLRSLLSKKDPTGGSTHG